MGKDFLLLAGVVLPIACFAMAFPESPEWQSGSLSDYAELLLGRGPSLPFYPLLIYCMVSMTLLVRNPDRWSKSPVVRFGIYTGTALALHYCILFAVANEAGVGLCIIYSITSLWSAVIVWVVVTGLDKLMSLCREKSSWRLGVASVIGIAVVFELALAAFGEPVLLTLGLNLVFAVFLICLVFSTLFAFLAYASMSCWLLRDFRKERLRFTLAQLFAWLTWLAVYFSAWRTAVLIMLAEYSKLPTEPSDCYVATAAARGHRWLVGSEDCFTVAGVRLRVNRQMRVLKSAELAMAAVCPSVHRMVRTLYNRIGPVAASMLCWPVLADLAYLSLKPAEWLARCLLAILLRGKVDLTGSVYPNSRQ